MARNARVARRSTASLAASMTPLLHQLLLFTKLVAVLAYAGGACAALLGGSLPERRRAVHRVASPALLSVWLSGYLLAESLGVGLLELWVLGGLVGSFVSLAALIASLHVEWRAVFSATVVAALVLVLALMVFRPTWGDLS